MLDALIWLLAWPRLIVLVAACVALGAWGDGRFDRALADWGMNARDCYTNATGAAVCGRAHEDLAGDPDWQVVRGLTGRP